MDAVLVPAVKPPVGPRIAETEFGPYFRSPVPSAPPFTTLLLTVIT